MLSGGHEPMKNFSCLVFSSGALVVVALTAALLEPVWASDLGLNGWTLENLLLPELQQLLANRRKNEELVRVIACFKQVSEERVRAAQQLYDGRATLFETAAIFRRLDRICHSDMRCCTPKLTSHMDDEQVCHEVIDWMTLFLTDEINAAYYFSTNKKNGAQFIARIEEELQKHKERYGIVTLPGEGTKAP
jgi:hypothetical protein